LDLIKELNPDADILITVSPVPLDATFTDEDVITANLHSKSVLRSTVGEIVADNPKIGYFPSYESIMLTRDWSVYEADLRHVTDEAVGQLVIDLSGSYFPTENPEVVEALNERLSLTAKKSNQYHRKIQFVELALQKQDFDEAISLLEESLDVAPERLKGGLKTRIANVCLRNEDRRLAEIWIDSAMDDGEKNASVFFIKARICKGNDDEKEARRYAETAQELSPGRQEITDFLNKL
jgi:tetratricopeptide (TPR) repeat protein